MIYFNLTFSNMVFRVHHGSIWLSRIMDDGEIWPICEIGETLGM